MDEAVLRRAIGDDVDAIEGLVAEAFGKYVERIGKPPAPMVADYAALLDESRIWVVERRDAIVAVLVTQTKVTISCWTPLRWPPLLRVVVTAVGCWSERNATPPSRD
jgi:hypothetical protein